MCEDDCRLPDIGAAHAILLGRYDDSHTFQTLPMGLCDVRVYSRALEASEVAALYAGEDDSGSSVDGLEVWYKMDATDFDAAMVRDSSGHERHATVERTELQLSLTGGCEPHSNRADENAAMHARVNDGEESEAD